MVAILHVILSIVLFGCISTAHDIPNKIVKRQEEECDEDGVADACLSLIEDIDSRNFRSNTTEFNLRVNAETVIRCTEPCFSILRSYYECTGATEDLRELTLHQCLQYNGTYCYPRFRMESQQGNFQRSDESCGNFTFNVCSDQCQEDTQHNIGILGCCGTAIANSGFFGEPEAFALCGIDLNACSTTDTDPDDDTGDAAAGFNASFFGLVVALVIVAFTVSQ